MRQASGRTGVGRRHQQAHGGRAGRAAGGAQARGARQAGAGHAGWLWAVHSVHSACFWPGSTRYFFESNFWTLFVNPVHEHCSSQIFIGKKYFKFY